MRPGGGRGLAEQQEGQQQQQQEAQDGCGDLRVPSDPGGEVGRCLGWGPGEPGQPMSDRAFSLVTRWGSPESLGMQGAQAELAPDRPPDRDQLLLHRHQGLAQVRQGRAAGQKGGRGDHAGLCP